MIADSSCPLLERKSLFNLRTDFTYCTKELGDTWGAPKLMPEGPKNFFFKIAPTPPPYLRIWMSR